MASEAIAWQKQRQDTSCCLKEISVLNMRPSPGVLVPAKGPQARGLRFRIQTADVNQTRSLTKVPLVLLFLFFGRKKFLLRQKLVLKILFHRDHLILPHKILDISSIGKFLIKFVGVCFQIFFFLLSHQR